MIFDILLDLHVVPTKQPKVKKGFLDFLFPPKPVQTKIVYEQKLETNTFGKNLKFEGERPSCKECKVPMKLIIQIDDKRIVEKPVQVFQCQSDPGQCEDWNAESGANKVIFNDHLNAILSEKALNFVSSGYSDAQREETYEFHADNAIGKALGKPLWIQSDETPHCCQQPMQFILQIDGGFGLNFGDSGIAYLFQCTKCKEGKFLWQCH